MKRIICISLVCVMMTGLFSACGKSLEADRDTVYVQKRGAVVSAAIADFDKDYYDEEELKSFVEQRVEEYQKEQGKDSVKIDKFSVEEGVAKLYMKYDDYEVYQDFNEVKLFKRKSGCKSGRRHSVYVLRIYLSEGKRYCVHSSP